MSLGASIMEAERLDGHRVIQDVVYAQSGVYEYLPTYMPKGMTAKKALHTHSLTGSQTSAQRLHSPSTVFLTQLTWFVSLTKYSTSNKSYIS